MVNVVITGGAGFLGSRLARELLAAGSLEAAGGAARHLIDDAGHMPQMERPAEVQAAIEKTIARAG